MIRDEAPVESNNLNTKRRSPEQVGAQDNHTSSSTPSSSSSSFSSSSSSPLSVQERETKRARKQKKMQKPASFEVPEEAKNIDLDLYSRQYYVYGGKAMSRMAEATVFISGLGGLGVEIAKNVALAGVKSLTLHDTKEATMADMATQFYVGEGDLGKNRAQVSVGQITELNPYVKVSVDVEDLNTKDLSYFNQFRCVILTETPLHLQKKINDYCHENGIAFISSDVRGVFCWCFCDFGKEFSVHDSNGEEPLSVMIENVTKASPAVVTCLDKAKHGFEDGMYVQFREVKGMTQLNEDGRVFEVVTINPYQFSLHLIEDERLPPEQRKKPQDRPLDSASFSDYVSGGVVTEVKKTIRMSFLPLSKALEEPDILIADWSKMDYPPTLHVGMQALDAFSEKNGGQLPKPWDEADAEQILAIAKEINKDKTKLEEALLKKLSYTARGSVVGITGFIGGMAAQEAIKSVTGKFTPLHQWLYADFVELLPTCAEGEKLDTSQCLPQGNRYDSQVICIGKELQERLGNLKLFMIGSGAIGCEMLKNFAMLGVSAGMNGKITITDNDLIEKSNLNRQFLFRPKDVGKAKSTSAAAAAKAMNSAITVDANLEKVGKESEHIYTDDFFKRLDIVVNALDNIPARLYVDSRCVTNQKPLLESGTLSTKAHVQVIVPFLTESYGSKRDPPEKDVPFCTLKSFPNIIQHTIQWARDKFENLYNLKPQELNKFLAEPDPIAEIHKQGGNRLKAATKMVKQLESTPNNFEDCVKIARVKFEKYFTNKILQLLHNFPLDMKNKDGSDFWSGAKRPPTPAKFDANDPLHLDFVRYCACLWAKVWGIKPEHCDPRNEKDNDYLRQVCASVNIPPFKPKENKVIETDEKVKKEEAAAHEPPPPEFDEAAYNEIIANLNALIAQHKAFRTTAEEFEKDNDANFHIDFITATSNLRASNYAIPSADRLKTKQIAGRIMPAIATTTASVSGLVSLELIKIAKACKMEAYRNVFMNLGLPMFQFAEPFPCEKTKITDSVSVTIWDQWEVKDAEVTVRAFCNLFKEKYNLTVTGIFQGVSMIYVPIMPGHDARLPKKLRRLLERQKGQKYVDLVVTFENDDGSDVNGPPVRFWTATGTKGKGQRASRRKKEA